MINKRQLPVFKLETRELDAVPDTEYHFSGCISSDAIDAYDSRMAESSLKNFVNDAANGVPFQDSHSSESIRTLGRSFAAEIENGIAMARVRMLRDDTNTPEHMKIDEYIRRIQGGIYTSLSVGFHSERNICSICDGNIAIGWDRLFGGDEFCEHSIGSVYDDKRCTYTIEDARLAEISLVTTPANPDAEIIERAREFFPGTKDSSPPAPAIVIDDETKLLIAAGKSHRAELIKSAIQAGIRAEGIAFDAKKWEAQLNALDIDAIRSFGSTWQALGDARWKSDGRITYDSNRTKDNRDNLLPSYLVD